MFKITIKKILFIILALIFLAISTYIYLFFKIKVKNEETFLLKKELEDQGNKSNKLEIVSSNLKNTRKERDKINTYFVKGNSSGVVDFIEEIESLVKKNDLSIKVNSIFVKEKSQSIGVVEDMKLTLKVEGKVSNIFYFIKLLETIPWGVSFERINLEKNEDHPNQWVGVFNLNVLKLSDKNTE